MENTKAILAERFQRLFWNIVKRGQTFETIKPERLLAATASSKTDQDFINQITCPNSAILTTTDETFEKKYFVFLGSARKFFYVKYFNAPEKEISYFSLEGIRPM